MLTGSVNEQVPAIVFDKYACPVVEKEPTHKVEVAEAIGRVDWHCEVLAAFRRTIVAECFAIGKILPRHSRNQTNIPLLLCTLAGKNDDPEDASPVAL